MKSFIFAFLLCVLTNTAHATIFTDRDLFEAAIDIVYTETFQSLAGNVGGLGTTATFPSGLTAVVEGGPENELFVAAPGAFLNPTVALGPRQVAGRSGRDMLLDLAAPFQAVGFDYFSDFDGRVSGEYTFSFGRGGAPGEFALDTVAVAQAAAGLTTRDDLPGFPQTAFFGFVNDGNPLDLWSPNNPDPPLRGNVFFSNVFDPGLYDRVYMSTVDGSGSAIVDNVTVGFLSAAPPTSVPEPATFWLIVAGLAGLVALRLNRVKQRAPSRAAHGSRG